MEMLPEDYILGVWFACNKEGNDYMMTICKRNNEWLGEYRFRYRRDEKIFNSKDIKNFYDENPSFFINVSRAEWFGTTTLVKNRKNY